MEKTLEDLKSYLQRTYKIQPDRITRETSLLDDLEIKGDDVDEFFSRLIKDFSIDVKDLDLSRFFIGEEPFDFLSSIIRFFRKERPDKKPTIRIGDVERFINSGVLK
jgi:hypothetical protein